MYNTQCTIFGTLLVVFLTPSGIYSISVHGFSGKNVPTTAPGNPILLHIIDGNTAEIAWESVPADSIRGEFEGYKIIVTPEGDGMPREMRVGPNATSAIVDILQPDRINIVQILPYNGQYDGPSSNKLVIQMPTMPPGQLTFGRAYPMGRHAREVTRLEPPTISGLWLSKEIKRHQVSLNKNQPQAFEKLLAHGLYDFILLRRRDCDAIDKENHRYSFISK